MKQKTTSNQPVLTIPTLKNVKPATVRTSKSDGKLIFEFLIMDHGFSEKRFKTLTRDQQDYIESTLCVIIRSLCYHLVSLGKLK